MEQSVWFRNKKGLKLHGIVHEPKNYTTAVVFCHGFPSSSRGRTGSRIGKSFARHGYLVLRFDFSHTPPSEGRFADKLMSAEVEDIRAAIDFLQQHYPFKKLVLMGHSTGAIDASLYAHRDKRIDALVLSGPVSDLKHAARYDFSDEHVRDFWRKGFIIYNRPRHWVHRKKLKKAFYDEFFTLDIPKAMKRFRKPVLIIHGEQDAAIPSQKDPRELYALLTTKRKKLVIVPGADHSFTAPRHWRAYGVAIDRFIRKYAR